MSLKGETKNMGIKEETFLDYDHMWPRGTTSRPPTESLHVNFLNATLNDKFRNADLLTFHY